MNNLNQSWILLIVAGVFFFIFYLGWTLFESITGANAEFRLLVTPFDSNILVTPQLEQHFGETL
jgi:hypothetical protein